VATPSGGAAGPERISDRKDGVLYPESSLPDEVCHREKSLALAPAADDVWLEAMSLLAGADVKNITRHRDYRCIKGSNAETLLARNRVDNDRIIRAVFDEYGLKWRTPRPAPRAPSRVALYGGLQGSRRPRRADVVRSRACP
jgi:hypothetical protein